MQLFAIAMWWEHSDAYAGAVGCNARRQSFIRDYYLRHSSSRSVLYLCIRLQVDELTVGDGDGSSWLRTAERAAQYTYLIVLQARATPPGATRCLARGLFSGLLSQRGLQRLQSVV